MWRRVTRWLAAALLALCLDAGPAAAEQLALALHVHSTFSTGDQTIDELAARAEAGGLDGIVLTENYRLRIDYGLAPLRGLLRYGVTAPSVSGRELAAWLDAVRAARRAHPSLVILAGLEVIPHYYWSGSLLDGELTLHDTQKNLLLIGPDEPARWRFLDSRRPAPSWTDRVAPFWPLALAPLVGRLWRRERIVRARVGLYRLAERRRYRREAVAIGTLGLLLLASNLVMAARPFDAYAPDPDERAAQALIDRAREAGVASIWSLPEASDHHQIPVKEISPLFARLPWHVTVRTEPHPGALARTDGYTAFGALYQDTVRVTEPGGAWDRLLLDFQHGGRVAPPWGVGEIAFHREGAGRKRFGDVQTVVVAAERTPAAVLDALRAGAFYARQRQPDWALRLDEFSVTPAPDGVAVRVAVSTTDGRRAPVTLRLVRSGALWQELTATAPFDRQWHDVVPGASRRYYRVEVGQGDQHLVSNPVFLAVAPSGG
jgi:hypothetical protein